MSTERLARSMFDAVWRNLGQRTVTLKLPSGGARTEPAGAKEETSPSFENVRVVRGRVLRGTATRSGAAVGRGEQIYSLLVQELPDACDLNQRLYVIDAESGLTLQVESIDLGFDGQIAMLTCVTRGK